MPSKEGSYFSEDNASCKNPNCPKKDLEWNTIVPHITKAKNCKTYYSDAEIEAIREKSKQIQRGKKNEKANIETTSGAKKVKIKKQCKICKRYFVSLLKHLNQAETCKSEYGKDYKNLKSGIDKERKMAKSQANAKHYKDNVEVLSQAHVKYYNDKKEVVNEQKRLRYSIHKKEINERKKKKKPEERIKAFKRDIIHGPNYSCFSCKRILYKNSVKILKPSEIKALLEKLNENFLKKIDLYCFE